MDQTCLRAFRRFFKCPDPRSLGTADRLEPRFLTASGLGYTLGPRAAGMLESSAVISGFNAGLFLLIFLASVTGLRIGRWVAHIGTAAMLFAVGLLIVLLFVHPHSSHAHPHVSPQRPFSLELPVLTLMSLNLFSKIAFNGFTALEQVAVFAGETRNAARSILRSAWIAAPLVALIYILVTGSILTYTRAIRSTSSIPLHK